MDPPSKKRKLVGGRTNAASSPKPKSFKETVRVAEGCVGIGGQAGEFFCWVISCWAITYEIVPSATLSEEHQRGHRMAANFPGLSRSEDGDYLEGTSIPEQGSGSGIKTVNNAGVFHNSNFSHVNQGSYSTVSQGSSINVSNTFVSGNMVRGVNENGVSGAVLSHVNRSFNPDYAT
jgi:hypothetical protein